jgi:hypothetical protein
MPVVIKLKNNRSCPIVVCDFCGQEIEDVGDGNSQWKMEEAEEAAGATLYFTHKACCRPFEQANQGPLWGADQLDHFMAFLAANTNLDWEDAEQGAWVLASLE